jgi:hypothetical protein
MHEGSLRGGDDKPGQPLSNHGMRVAHHAGHQVSDRFNGVDQTSVLSEEQWRPLRIARRPRRRYLTCHVRPLLP